LALSPSQIWRQLLHNRTVPVTLRGHFTGDMSDAVRARKKTVEIVEASVLGVDHHNVFDLVDARGLLGRSVRSAGETCAVSACSQSQYRRE
jgi:hypothetical protein